MHAKLGDKKNAVFLLDSLLTNHGDRFPFHVRLSVMCNLYQQSTDKIKKHQIAHETYELTRNLEPKILFYYVSILNLAKTLKEENKTKEAIRFFEEVMNYAKEKNSGRMFLPAIYGIAQCYDLEGNTQLSNDYFLKYYLAKDSLGYSDTATELEKMRAANEFNLYQNEIIINQQKSQLKLRLMIIIVLLSIMAILILILMLFNFYNKKRAAVNNLKYKELQNKTLILDIDSKNRELSSTLLILHEKNAMLTDLNKQMKLFHLNGKISKECEEQLSRQINETIRTDNDWESFKLHFDKVHPQFFQKLKQYHPELSQNDLKLCAYIRIGLNAKQIGQMINVLPNTVKSNRYLLKKKLEIDSDISLDEYIAHM